MSDYDGVPPISDVSAFSLHLRFDSIVGCVSSIHRSCCLKLYDQYTIIDTYTYR